MFMKDLIEESFTSFDEVLDKMSSSPDKRVYKK